MRDGATHKLKNNISRKNEGKCIPVEVNEFTLDVPG